MVDATKKRLLRATIVFWIFLIYIIAALVWWFLSLEQQNREMYELKKDQLRQTIGDSESVAYKNGLLKIENIRERNTIKYIGEGATFLLFIIFGAVFIYRSARRQFQMQQQQQNFVMAVTHELKTPISVARLNLEMLQRYSLEPTKQGKLLQVSLQETMRLDTLINNILISSQLDSDAYNTSKEELDFSDLVADAVQQFQNRYKNRKVIAQIEKGIELQGDALLLKLLVSNLLENANKYSDKAASISCTLYKKANFVTLQVIDEGIGIADAEKKKIFQKFYRIGNEQTRKSKGTGLGLYICKKIAEAHKADILMTDNNPQGSIFTIRFSV
ncbi:MAG: sensor histidine kinase [Chitinophagaceae bacterium]